MKVSILENPSTALPRLSKVLYWDKTGFALWYKRLEKAKYKWPTKEKSEVFTLTQFELDRLLSGFTIIGHKPVRINDFTMT
ncbi:IS66 family insertion sequence element accessory protein TnpB [Vibrio sp. ABG19]|uniref:IS66 family insertion sequence element accessory protein TnpB n=1 Tax=Vibrio sp. ABG19 TaxID=2817385 RepID=UPI00249E7FCD|nr:IS66 family insertion sequence element accessory protein TnpB [Vibrio sp. ABG19]WGY46866.1 IS66 family insertion sequence element accessory protein TnpB [Vibrio sp. ABG19]